MTTVSNHRHGNTCIMCNEPDIETVDVSTGFLQGALCSTCLFAIVARTSNGRSSIPATRTSRKTRSKPARSVEASPEKTSAPEAIPTAQLYGENVPIKAE